ncbi:MAG: (Fe-S)-binding protein [Acholeplasma sp.]|nr:(Fe-S)-binding protein [Acholeplasma sp.]
MIESTLVLGGLGLLLGLGLALAAKYLEVKEDERIAAVEKMLPNYNCGACGTPGCHAFAVEIVSGRAGNISRCKPGKPDKHYNPILQYLKEHPNEDGSAVNIKL